MLCFLRFFNRECTSADVAFARHPTCAPRHLKPTPSKIYKKP